LTKSNLTFTLPVVAIGVCSSDV